MQNTIIREFVDDPRVFVAPFQQGGSNGETREWLEVFWRNNYLRDKLIWDEFGTIGSQVYKQPSTGLPFGRGFIIDRDGHVVLPYFGHQPQMVINKIHELLEGTGIEDGTSPSMPASIRIGNFPNPFNPNSTIEYEMSASGIVIIEVLDLKGRVVRILKRGVFENSGRHQVIWEGDDNSGQTLPSGAYLLRIVSGQSSKAIQVTLVK